jgi:hypothetical protein
MINYTKRLARGRAMQSGVLKRVKGGQHSFDAFGAMTEAKSP